MGEETKEKTGITKEELELRYESLYPDLSKDAIKMLINTHPLYNEENADEEKEEELKKTKKKKEVKKEEEGEKEENEFIKDLFSDENKEEMRSLTKYAITAALAVVVFICIIVIIVMGNKNKSIQAELDTIKIKNDELSLKYEEFKLQKDYSDKENQRLQTVIAQLQEEVGKINTNQTNQSQQNQPSTGNENNTNSTSNTGNTNSAGNNASSSNTTNTGNSTSSSEEKIHIVQKGETLWKISEKEYGNGNYYTKIMEYNGLTENSVLSVGMKIKIPNIK